MTPRSEDPHHLNGWPSWPQLFDIVSEIRGQLGGLHTGQRLMHQQMQTGFDRVHLRIDNLHRHGQEHIDRLQERVTVLEARPSPQATATGPEGLLARLKGWAEMVAPLRELVMLAAVILASLAGLAQAPTVKAALVGMAAALGTG